MRAHHILMCYAVCIIQQLINDLGPDLSSLLNIEYDVCSMAVSHCELQHVTVKDHYCSI